LMDEASVFCCSAVLRDLLRTAAAAVLFSSIISKTNRILPAQKSESVPSVSFPYGLTPGNNRSKREIAL
jgi:hypothetical protein